MSLTKVTSAMFDGTAIYGVENYIGNPGAEVNTTGWSLDSVSAATRPSGALNGTTAGMTLTRSTSAPLSGSASFRLVKDAANRQGQLLRYNFAVPSKSKGKTLDLRMSYIVISGTFAAHTVTADSDLIVYCRLYNGSTYTWVAPDKCRLKSNSTSTAGEVFTQVSMASDTISADFVLYVPTTNASTWTIEFDDVFASPGQKAFEEVNCKYTSTATTNILTTDTQLTYATKLYDTDDAMSGSTWYAPSAGTYEIELMLNTASAAWNDSGLYATLWKSGSFDTLIAAFVLSGSGASVPLVAHGNTQFKATEGQAITFYAYQTQTGGGRALSGSATLNKLSIKKIGR